MALCTISSFQQNVHFQYHTLSCLVWCQNIFASTKGEGEGEVAFFSAKHWDRRNRADLIESATPCHDALVVGPYRDSNPLRLTVLAAMSGDYTTAPQHLHERCKEYLSRQPDGLTPLLVQAPVKVRNET